MKKFVKKNGTNPRLPVVKSWLIGTSLFVLCLPMTAYAIKKSEVFLGDWAAENCPNEVPPDESPYYETIFYHGMNGDEEKRMEIAAKDARFTACSRIVYTALVLGATMYDSGRESQVGGVAGGMLNSSYDYALSNALHLLKKYPGAYASDGKTLDENSKLYKLTLETVDYGFSPEMADRAEAELASDTEDEPFEKVLGNDKFCECLKIPAEDFSREETL